MKRMFDKEEIVEIAKEEGGSVTVDSELSPTSENPVQNKVIYEALQDKLDSSTNTLIILNVTETASSTDYNKQMGIILPRKDTNYTVEEVISYLQENHATSTNRLKITFSSTPLLKSSTNMLGVMQDIGIYASSTQTRIYGWQCLVYSFAISNNAISITQTNGNLGAYDNRIVINSIAVQY